MQFITLTTDLGLKDYYVASIKSIIYQQCKNDIRLIDLSHGIKPFDVSEAAFVISQAYQSFPENSIHIIGVDPEPIIGSPTDSSLPSILVYDNHYFVSNDNGFFGALVKYGESAKLYTVSDILPKRNEFTTPIKSLLVPIASRLANGEPIESFATPIDHYKKALVNLPITQENLIVGTIIYVDGYGNAITNIDKQLFDAIGTDSPFQIHIRRGSSSNVGNIIDEISTSYGDVPQGEKVALFNENQLLEIAINRGANNAAGGAQKLLGLQKGDSIRVDFAPRGSKNTLDELFNTQFG